MRPWWIVSKLGNGVYGTARGAVWSANVWRCEGGAYGPFVVYDREVLLLFLRKRMRAVEKEVG